MTKMKRILVIDDDSEIRYSLKRVLEARGFQVILAASGEEGIEVARKEQPGVVLSDNRMTGITGLETLQHVRAHVPNAMVIIMTAYATTQTAIEAMKHGAFDYIVKPFELKRILELTERAWQAHCQLHAADGSALPGIDAQDYIEGMVGNTEAMRDVFKLIGQVAPSDATVMITGESGTGKELVARCIYRHSRRNNGPFVAVNCAAIPENLIESELFGHEKGSFTGATNQKPGRFELADKGTIFLDELGDMTLPTQTKILRVLQEGEIQRVGGTETIKVDVRLVAATNKDLEQMVRERTFREDLYYRLNVFRLRLPPLRERREDIPVIAHFLLQKLATKSKTPLRKLTAEAIRILMDHDWPGNVRELENTIQHSAVLSQGNVILPSDLPIEVRESSKRKRREMPEKSGDIGGSTPSSTKAEKDITPDLTTPESKDSPDAGGTLRAPRDAASEDYTPMAPPMSSHMPGQLGLGVQLDLTSTLDHMYKQMRNEHPKALLMAVEKEVVLRALKETDGNQLKASEILGISRSTLRKRIEEFDINSR
ncbi:MAG: sigma-54 dependent transcriptional regulator [Opitutales bacterium]|nr:sigma-54 dependent transcriptional regulator [Opitutales bacterium]